MLSLRVYDSHCFPLTLSALDILALSDGWKWYKALLYLKFPIDKVDHLSDVYLLDFPPKTFFFHILFMFCWAACLLKLLPNPSILMM